VIPTIIIQPAALDRETAAAYVGLSVTTMESQAQAGLFPQPRQIGARRVVWLREELDAHLRALPVSTIRPGPGRQAAPAAAPSA
jgi:predicted DNA-binding transcriptional regulator AlpA